MPLFNITKVKASITLLLTTLCFIASSQDASDKVSQQTQMTPSEIIEMLDKAEQSQKSHLNTDAVNHAVKGAQQNTFKLQEGEGSQLQKIKEYDPSLLKAEEKNSNPLWDSFYEGANQQQSFSEKAQRYGDVKAFILVSLSMPAISLEKIFTEVAYQYPNEDIIFVFQGWEAPHFSLFNSRVNKLLPTEKAPVVVIDPTIFKKLEVSEVPYFAINLGDKGWKKVAGDVSYFSAVEEANSHYEKFVPIGKTYPISEPNILDYIYDKIEKADWDSQIAQATDKLIQQKSSQVNLQNAVTSYRYLVDGTVTINDDISSQDSDFVDAGTTVNPLEHMNFTSQYAIIDATSATQLGILRHWKTIHSNVKMMTTTLPDVQIRSKLTKEFGEVHQIDPLLTKRFGLERVPSLVYQNGHKLVVEVVQHDIDLKQLNPIGAVQ
jgi:conjugal transfer pilus assembly protein TraW